MKKDNTLKELLILVFGIGVIEQIICLIFFHNHLYNAVGLWVGILLMMGFAIHMKRSIEDALGFPEKAAQKYMRASSIKRMAAAGVVMGVLFYFNWGNPLTVLGAVFALKIAAYVQPMAHRKLFERER